MKRKKMNWIEPLITQLFAACNNARCCRKVWCKRSGYNIRHKRNNVVYIDGKKCRANKYKYFVGVSSEDTGSL